MHLFNKPFGYSFALLLSLSSAALAQMGPPLKEGQTTRSLEGVYIYQGNADLDTGGDFSVQTASLQASYKRGLADGHSIGFGLSVGLSDYSFSDPTDFGGVAPWDTIERYGLNLQYNYQIDRTQSLFFMPSIEFAGESGADFGDGLTFGGIAGYAKQFSRSLTLGFGGAVFTGLEDTKAFPVILLNWQFTENWRLSNPFRPGPSGPAGLEFVYTGLDSWELSVGAGYRSNRFALDDSDGYGENEGAVLFIRGTHAFSERSKLDLYLGTLVGGELSLDDSDGDTLASVDHDPSVILAVSYTLSF
jgi:hypothetical protein